jgi:hypothetical protein
VERAREEVEVSRHLERASETAEAWEETPPPLTVGSRVMWDDDDGRWPGVVTAYRGIDGVVIKLDGGGTFTVPLHQLQRIT